MNWDGTLSSQEAKAMSNLVQPIKINGSLDRTGKHFSPTAPDDQCEYFEKRFIGWGRMNERRGICEATIDDDFICDYRRVTTDGTPLCLRYWYGPKYEIVDAVPEPEVQKKNVNKQPLYYDGAGAETTAKTKEPVMIPLSEAKPVPYLNQYHVQKIDINNKPLYLDTTVTPPVETAAPSGKLADGSLVVFKPVLVYIKPHFYSDQFVDTHGKRFYHNGNELGWHFDV